MAIEEKEQQETLLKDLIEKIEKDPLPTNIFTIEDTDPLVLLGKLNEVIAILKQLKDIISSSDTKASEALTKALDALIKAGEALQVAQEAKTTAETIGNEAKDTADKAIDIASKAQEKAEVADSTAIEAVNDATEALSRANNALQVANEALLQVVEGLGTKIFDNHGNLMANAKLTGHNGINVDMSETDPETFDIRLDDAITTAIKNNQGEIERVTTRVTANEEDIIELTNMLTATEELAQQNTETIENDIKPVLLSPDVKKWIDNEFDKNLNLWNDAWTPRLDFYLPWATNTSHTLALEISTNPEPWIDNLIKLSGDLSTTGIKSGTFTASTTGYYYMRIGYNGNVEDDKYKSKIYLEAGTYTVSANIILNEINHITVDTICMYAGTEARPYQKYYGVLARKPLEADGVLPVYPLSNYDANQCIDAGIYLISQGSNLPSSTQNGSLLVMPYRQGFGNSKTDYATQIFLSNGDDNTGLNNIYFRTSKVDSWNGWIAFNNKAEFSFLSKTSFQSTDSTATLNIPKKAKTFQCFAQSSGGYVVASPILPIYSGLAQLSPQMPKKIYLFNNRDIYWRGSYSISNGKITFNKNAEGGFYNGDYGYRLWVIFYN